jgi:ABC-type uncharacterized transport system auxiliary subunit
MTAHVRPVLAAALLALLLCDGCLFHDAPAPRYFAPPSALEASDPPPSAASAALVRLRRVRSAAYLGEQMAWRVSDVERGLYEQRRWTDTPDRYLTRALDQALDATPGLQRVESGPAANLDVELVAFDEVLRPTHEAQVTVVASLHGTDHRTLFEHRFSAAQPIADAHPASTARAMGAALDAVARQIASQVATSLPAGDQTRAAR